ncbi:MAG: hypothetical protein ACLUOF_09380 [Ruminococcus sp.]
MGSGQFIPGFEDQVLVTRSVRTST